uniref:Integrase zinc-binding domain-containing protein n=1 Tax=Moniliophthora roreri TaxID=221103 RepID=A0A0W0G4J0_MONRR
MRPPENEEDYLDNDDGEPVKFKMGEDETDPPYPFKDFREEIDTRGGYYLERAVCVEDFTQDLEAAAEEMRMNNLVLGWPIYELFTQIKIFPPALTAEWQEKNPYVESHYTMLGKKLDEALPDIISYLTDEDWIRQKDLDTDYEKFIKKQAQRFFVDKEGRLYRRNEELEGQHKLVVLKNKRMWMMSAAHDYVGHKGIFATEQLLKKRFLWPELEYDVEWSVKLCQPCQDRQLNMIKIPPTWTHTLSLFQKIHIDIFKLSPASNSNMADLEKTQFYSFYITFGSEHFNMTQNNG